MSQDVRAKEIAVSIERMRDELDKLEAKLTKSQGTAISPKLGVLFDVYKRRGPIKKSELEEIARRHKYKRWGSFFKGTNKSLTRVFQEGEERIGLTSAGVAQLDNAGLI